MTELSPVSHCTPEGQFKPGTSGVTVSNTEIRIVEASTGADLGVGERGELLVRGPQVMKGYLNNPEATADTLDADGWLHTGDVAVIDDDHHVSIVDRIKELIKYKAFQVAPAELEAVLVTHPAVADAAVVGVPRRGGGGAAQGVHRAGARSGGPDAGRTAEPRPASTSRPTSRCESSRCSTPYPRAPRARSFAGSSATAEPACGTTRRAVTPDGGSGMGGCRLVRLGCGARRQKPVVGRHRTHERTTDGNTAGGDTHRLAEVPVVHAHEPCRWRRPGRHQPGPERLPRRCRRAGREPVRPAGPDPGR